MDSTTVSILPPPGSTFAQEVDPLFNFLTIASIIFFLLVLSGVIVFSVKYRRRKSKAAGETTGGPSHNTLLELSWMIIPLILVIIVFFWGFKGFLTMSIVPKDAIEIKVTAQKWFWSFDYPEGLSTVNEIVVPVGQPVKLIMSSKDVIHSFFVPAFRMKRDVLPNRYTIAWFEATQLGEFELFCAEYCGTKHSEMVGKVKVVTDREFKDWLESSSSLGEGMTPAEFGAKLYVSKACATCHSVDGSRGNGPTFLGVYGSETKFSNSSPVIADENYIRESILNPRAKIVIGYQPIMPTYQGLLRDEELDALIAYMKTLGGSGE